MRQGRKHHALGVILAGLTAVGCAEDVSEEVSSGVGQTTLDCVVPVPEGVTELGAPVSLEYPGASLLIWETLTLSDGTVIPNAVARVESAAELCSSGPSLVTDASGAPQALLTLSEAEVAETEQREDGRKLVLAPRGGLSHDGVGYLYYEHVLLGLDVFDAEVLGTGLCVVSTADEPCRRIEHDGSTILWPPSAWPKNQGGVVYEDRALLLGCRQIAVFENTCAIAGVPLDQIEDPTAYRYYSAFSDWPEEPTAASGVLHLGGATTLTAVNNRYAATNFDVFEPVFRLRFGKEPTGDYGSPVELFRGIQPTGPFTRGGREHHALAENNHSLVFSYFVDQPGDDYGLRLVQFELNRDLH